MPGADGLANNKAGQQVEFAAPPIVNIIGDKVALGPLRRDLIPSYSRWFNDFTVRRTRVRPPRGVTLEEQEREYDALVTSTDRHFFTVYDHTTWQPIGDAGLQGIDHRHRSAFFAI